MNRFKLIIGAVCIIYFVGCSSSTEPMNGPSANIFFTPNEVNTTIGETLLVSLEISELSEAIFGMSLQIGYDSTYISFSDTSGIESGDFLGADAITFSRISDSIIHLSITRIQGQESVSGSGVICTLPIVGKTIGNSSIRILRDDVHFFNVVGDELEIPGLETQNADVMVQ